MHKLNGLLFMRREKDKALIAQRKIKLFQVGFRRISQPFRFSHLIIQEAHSQSAEKDAKDRLI